MWRESTAKGQRITSTPVVSWSVGDSGGWGGGERRDLEARFAPGAPRDRGLP